MKVLLTPPKCALCDKDAITTAAHIPVCEQHHNAYQEEGRKYLPESERVVWKALNQAVQKHV